VVSVVVGLGMMGMVFLFIGNVPDEGRAVILWLGAGRGADS
jgi:hypothetical protein